MTKIKALLEPVNLDLTQKAYTAGIIDGEGHITIIRTNKEKGYLLTPIVGVANTDPRMLDFLRKHLHFAVFVEAPYQGITQRRKVFRGMVKGFRTLPLLEAIEPYLIAKREQAQLLMDFCRIRLQNRAKSETRHYQEEELKIRAKILELNSRRGASYEK